MVYDPNKPKRIYEIRPGVFTIGFPGEYAPRVKRILNAAGRGRPTYRRIRGGEVPRDLAPVLRLPTTLYNMLKYVSANPGEA